jgi:two-component sensor histidine kinase
MALIHEQLYQSRDLAHIDFARYVRDLTAHLFRTYKTQGTHVRLVIEVSNVFLDADQAIPCGMIINELVSNSLKHAFPEGREGMLRIATDCEDEAMLRLTVEDNGTGFPENVDPVNAPSLGLKLVRMLTDQLRGSLALQHHPGTSFTIRFSTTPARRP